MSEVTDYKNSNVSPERDALRNVYSSAIVAASREAADEACIRAGAAAGSHPWRRVPDNKVVAVTRELEKMVSGSSSARQPERRERSFGQGAGNAGKPKSFAEAFNADKVSDIYIAWNQHPADKDDED